MASPFRIFRKHQKTLLAVACVVLMFVFVLGSSLNSLFRQTPSGGDARRHPDAVAVSWNGGQLTNRELGMLVFRRQLVNMFVRSIEAAGRQMVADSGAEVRPLGVALVGGPDRPAEGVEQDVVQTAIFADAAHKAGMEIDNDEILQYLQEVGRGRVGSDQMRAILGHLQVQGRAATDAFMMDALREELLARNFLLSYQYALRTVLPEEKWRDWLRVNDRVVVEAAAIPVSSSLIDVKEPTEEQLTEFFDKYKQREPQPDVFLNTELPSRWPGFAVPRKIDVRYVLAEFDKFIDEMEGEVTDEEIEKYYEDNKYPYFVRADTARMGDTGEAGEAGSTDDQPDSQGPAASDARPSPDAKDSATPSDEPAPAAEDGSSDDRAPGHSKFRLAAFQQEDQPDDEATEAAPSDGTGDEATTAGEAAGQPASASTTTGKTEEKPVAYQPLEEVRDQIRRQLAEQKVNDRLSELIGRLEGELQGEYTKYLGDVFNAEALEKPAPAPPAELADLDALAEKNGLQSDETGPVSILQLRDLPIGKSVTADENNYRFVLYAFSRDLEPYQPVTTFDLDGNRYLAIKTSDTPGKVPTLDEVRDEVVQAWKMQQAADLALKHAEELAQKIQTSGSWLADYFANDKNVHVVRTDPFSWLTIGSVSPRTGAVDSFRLSQPEGIVAAGPEFMRDVFDLKGNEVGAVLNHDHTIAYVLRVVEHQDTEEQLRQAFLSEANQWYGLGVMTQSHMQLAGQVLVKDFMDNVYQVDWKRPADEVNQED